MMIPLTKAKKQVYYEVVSLLGNTESNRFFDNIGCSVGEKIMVISTIGSNYVVKIKDGRFGIDKRFAEKIMVKIP
ncbi:MAG: FeoA domain-containing protein [Candidatus Izemoplasmataceae bacterium]